MRVGRYDFNLTNDVQKVTGITRKKTDDDSSAKPSYSDVAKKIDDNSSGKAQVKVNNTSFVDDKNQTGLMKNINATGISGSNPAAMSDLVDAVSGEDRINGLVKSLEIGKSDGDTEKLKRAAQEFEEIYLNIILKQMRKTVGDGGGFIEKSFARSMYEDMYFENISKSISKGGGMGLGKMMYDQMVKAYTDTEEIRGDGDMKEKKI